MSAENVGKRCRWTTYPNARIGQHEGEIVAHVPALTSIVRKGNGIVSNVGIENVGIDDAGAPDAAPVTVRLTFVEPLTGAVTGAQPLFALASGQVVQLNDAAKQNAILFVDEVSGTAQIRGYVVMKDTTTNDGSFVFMQTQ